MNENKKEDEVKDFFDPRLDDLKKAVIDKTVVKGIREVIRNIEKNKVEKLYIATNETLNGKYKESLENMAKKSDKLNSEKIIFVSDYAILRDVVMTGDLQFVNNLRGIKAKGPKCYCAAIIPKENK